MFMSRTNKNTFMREKRLRVSVVQDPSAACHLRGQSTGLVSASGIETMDWPSWSTAEYNVVCTYAKLPEGWPARGSGRDHCSVNPS